MPKFDDVGSYPLPENVEKERFKASIKEFEQWAVDIALDTMKAKVESGVEIPCYPQLRDMVDQFLEPLKSTENLEEPYLIRENNAKIPELEATESLGLDSLKMCLTGPSELAIAEFEDHSHREEMLNIARSLNRYVENAQKRHEIKIVSVDEPSLGFKPRIAIDEELLISAWNMLGKTDADVEIHLHSPQYIKIACKSEGIDVIDIATASSVRNLKMMDEDMLESYGKNLRVGISRTDVWKDADSPEEVAERIEDRIDRFGDLIKYYGPDCGLGALTSTRIAKKVLENTKAGIEISRGR